MHAVSRIGDADKIHSFTDCHRSQKMGFLLEGSIKAGHGHGGGGHLWLNSEPRK